jgi:hypothetical protein
MLSSIDHVVEFLLTDVLFIIPNDDNNNDWEEQVSAKGSTYENALLHLAQLHHPMLIVAV